MNDHQADVFVLTAMALVAIVAVALMLSGCSSWYETRTATITLPPPAGAKLAVGEQPAQVVMFEKWTSLWSAVCGAVVTYQNGQPAQMIPGNCGTPLTLLMNSPINMGMAAAVAASVK